MKNLSPTPILKVFSIIDSCRTIDQLEVCKRLIDVYINLIKNKGVLNFDLVEETLKIKLREKQEKIEKLETFYAR